MSDFVPVTTIDQIPAGEGRAFPVEGKMIAVFFADGEYFAIDDACPHMGASLAEGYVEEGAVMCPWHAWRFCVRDGLWLDNPRSQIRTSSYPVKVEGDQIYVQLIPPETKPDADSSPS